MIPLVFNETLFLHVFYYYVFRVVFFTVSLHERACRIVHVVSFRPNSNLRKLQENALEKLNYLGLG